MVRWAARRVRRVRWSGSELRARYCRRGPAEVIASGELHFTAPCADLSALVACGLQEGGARPTLVLGGITRAWRPVKFQCGLEVEVGGEVWVVGFAIAATYCYVGRFEPTRRRPYVHRVQPQEVDPERPFLAYFEAGGVDEVERRVPGYDWERDMRDHVRRSGRWAYGRQRRLAGDPRRAEGRGRLEGGAGVWE